MIRLKLMKNLVPIYKQYYLKFNYGIKLNQLFCIGSLLYTSVK